MRISSARRAVLTLAAGAALCVAPLSVAGPVAVDLTATGFANGSQSFDVTAPTATNVPTGAFTGTLDGNPIVFFCFELTQYFSFGPATLAYEDSILPSGPQYTALSELFTEGFASVLSPNPVSNSAGFQLAIWEILYDSPPSSLNDGSFYVTNDHGNTTAVTRANTLLAGLSGSQALYTIHLLHNEDSQDFIYGVPPLQQQIPEPAPLLLIGAALVAMMFGLRSASKHRA